VSSKSIEKDPWQVFDDPDRQLCLRQSALDLTPLPIGIASPEGLITFVNPAMARLWRLQEPGDMVGLPVSILWVDGVAVMRRLCYLGSADEGTCEEVALRLDGSTFPVRFHKRRVDDPQGRCLGVVACFEELTELQRLEQDRKQLIAGLAKLVSNVKTLRGVVPICAWCKKIRDEGGHWQQLESFMHDHTEAHFSHGACPECAERLFERDGQEPQA